MTAESDITIRHCHSLEEFRQCVTVQQAVWGFEDQDLIPVRMFVVARKIEGQVIGAFDSERMIGFVLALPALHGPSVYLHSHMLAVLPDYRERGIGRRLKLEQRQDALARGIKLIEWTFDPLELKNAHFNIERLGAIARRYVVNQYGISSSPLHRGLPTDRLIAEWRLESPRVIARTAGELLAPPDIRQRISVPLGVAETDRRGTMRAGVQLEVRRQFQDAFSQGLAVVGFEFSEAAGAYLIGPWEGAE